MKKTDTIPAMLTKHEAVLVPNAAELLGRDTIKRLNDHGNMLAKRGVDLASDPTPGPSTINLLGYQMGTYDVGRDDRTDLLAEADAAFYGGVPAPTPTPTPMPRGYVYGTSSVEEYGSPFLNRKKFGLGATSYFDNNQTNGASRASRRPVTEDMANTAYTSKGGGYLGPRYDQFSGQPNPRPMGAVGLRGGTGNQNISSSRYIGQGGVDLGAQYGAQGDINPKPRGAVGVQGSPKAQSFNTSLNGFNPNQPPDLSNLNPADIAKNIAQRNISALTPHTNGSQLPSGVQQNISPEQAAEQGLQWGGRSWLPYVSPQQMTEQNLMYTGGKPASSANAPSPRDEDRYGSAYGY